MAGESNRVELLSAVGEAIGAWGLIEVQLTALFSIVSEMPNKMKSIGAFDSVINLEARLAMLNSIMRLENTDETETEMWFRYSARVWKSYKKRHEIAHFGIASKKGVAAVSPFLTLEKLISERGVSLSADQIRERAAKFTELAEIANWFIAASVTRRMPAGKGPPPRQPEPPNIVQLRELAVQILEDRKRPPQPLCPHCGRA